MKAMKAMKAMKDRAFRKRPWHTGSWMPRAAALPVALTAPTICFAQNCALCYTQAAGAGSRMIHALKSGILILMIPPMCICVGLAVMAYKKRNQFNDDYESQQ
jgi:hypothetical protein